MKKNIHFLHSRFVSGLAIAALAVFLLLPGLGWGQSILVDDFAGLTVGNLAGQSGWTKGGAGSVEAQVANTTALTYPNYNGGGAEYVSMPAPNNQVSKVYKALSTPPAGSTIIYYSILLRISNATLAGDYFISLGDVGTGTTYVGRLFAKSGGTGFNLGLAKGLSTGTYAATPTIYNYNQTYLIVVRYDFISGSSNDLVYLYVDPLLSSEPATSSAEVAISAGNGGSDQLSATTVGNFLWHTRSSNNPTGSFDGVRVSSGASSAAAWSALDAYIASPIQYAVTGSGSYCASGTGLPVGVANSEVGVNYTISPGGATVAGTGSAISFGNRTAGTYTVSGTNAGGTTAMSGSAVIIELPLPVSGTFTPTPAAGAVCEGTSVSATATAGSGGTGTVTDVLEYRFDGAASWTPYTSGTGLSTTGHTSVDIQTYRTATGSGCTTSTPVVVSWTVNPLPTASVSGNNGPVCSGNDATFSLTGTTDAVVTYSLDGGTTTATTPLTGGIATVTVAAATADQTLTLVSVDDGTCPKAIGTTSTVTVNALPTASVSGNNGPVCSGNDATFSLTGTTDAVVTYSLDGGTTTATTTLTGGIATVTVAAATADQTLTLVSVDDGTCPKAIGTTSTVTVNALPTASVSGNNGPVCSGNDATFSLTGTTAAVVTYSLDGGTTTATTTLTGGIATVTVAAATADQTLTLVSVDYATCTTTLSETSTVNVNPLPAPAGTIIGSATVNAGQYGVVYYVPVIADATSYVWTYTPATTEVTINVTGNIVTLDFSSVASSGTLTVQGHNDCGDGTISADFPINVVSANSPAITVTPATLSGFNYVAGSGPSAEQSFTVSGSNLTNDISIAAAADYEISLASGTGYTSPLTLVPNSGTVDNTTIYVRLKAGLSAGIYNTEDINITSTGATDKLVTCNGVVTSGLEAPLAFNVTGSGSYCFPGATGLAVGLSGSETGVTYNLYDNVPSIVDTKLGTGSAFTFDIIQPAGTYTVEGTFNGTTSMNGSAIITLSSAPTADAGTLAGDAAVVGYPYTFAATATNGSILWTWTGSATGILTQNNIEDPSFIPASTGVATFTLTVTGGAGCGSATDNIILYVMGTDPVIWLTSGSNTNWNDPANWFPALVPTSITNVLIPAGSSYNPIITSPAYCKDITIKSGTSGTASLVGDENLTVSGTAKVERYVTAGWATASSGWHLLSSPVSGQAITGSADWTPTTGTNNGYDFYAFDETVTTPYEYWVNQKDYPGSFTTFSVGKGYLVSYEAAGTRTFTGSLNQTDVTVSGLTNTSGSSHPGWNLVGNPFASAINWTLGSWEKSNIDAIPQVWDESTASYKTLTQKSNIIPAMNGFMVHTTVGGSLTIPKSAQVYNAAQWYKSADENFIVLNANDTEGKTAQSSLVRFDPLATVGYDPDLDSYFLAGYAPMFYSTSGNAMFALNTLPQLTSDLVVPFSFVKNTSTNFSIELSKTLPNLVLFLLDKKTNTTQNLSDNPVYNFTSADGDDPARFELSFLDVTSVPDPTKTASFGVYQENGNIRITTQSAVNADIRVVNMLGQVVLRGKTNGNSLTSLNASTLQNGVYVVSLVTEGKVTSKKVVVSK